MTALASVFTLCVVFVLAAPAAGDAWILNGAPVGPFDGIQYSPVITTDGVGGAFIVWEDWRSGPQTRTFVQHLTAGGDVSPGWGTGGLPLPSGGNRDHPVVLADAGGGVYIADDGTHQQYITSTFGRTRLYHLAGDGAPAAESPATGIEVTGDPYGIGGGVHGDYFPALALDGAGGVFTSWTFRDRLTDNVKANRFGPDGAVASGWPAQGEYAAPGFSVEVPVSACPDGFGGAFVAFERYAVQVARFDANGTIHPGWPMLVTTNTRQGAAGVASDGAGGVIVAWQENRNGAFEQTYAKRLNGDGSTAAGWPADGLAISEYATDAGIRRSANYDASIIRYSSILGDGAGGAFVAWTDYRSGPGSGDIYVQRLDAEGSPAAGWSPNGRALCSAPDDQSLPTLAPDGTGGVFATWQDRRSGVDYDVYAQHVGGGGSIAAGWTTNGMLVSNAPGDQISPVAVARDPFRAIVAWTDMRDPKANIYAGLASPDEPTATLVSLVEASASQSVVRLVWQVGGDRIQTANVFRRAPEGPWSLIDRAAPDGTGRIMVEDRDVVAGARYAYRLGWTGASGEEYSQQEWLAVPGPEVLSLGRAWPNPASEDLHVPFSLANATPASIALIDVAGRWVMEREIGSLGAGYHVAHFAGLNRLRPGVYLVRLTEDGKAMNGRVCVTR